MSDPEILVKLYDLLNSEEGNGKRMVRMAHEVAVPSKSSIQADVLTAIEWINNGIDHLFIRTARLISGRPDQRSELLLEQLVEDAKSIDVRLERLQQRISNS